MNIKKVAMMLTIMLITILSASSFYILTGEAELGTNIIVNSSKTEDGDYEKVYGEGPYTDSKGSYYIRYTGAVSGRTVIDLEDTNVTDKNGKAVDSGLTIDKDGNVVIMKTKITSTYKMFSYRKSTEATNTEITRVFIPSSITFAEKKNDSDIVGIQENTFDGTTQEIDCIYRTPNLKDNGGVIDARGSGLVNTYDKTGIINQSNVITYVCLDDKNIDRNGIVASSKNAYKGTIKNVFVSNEVEKWNSLFQINGDYLKIDNSDGANNQMQYVLLDDGSTWTSSHSLSFLFTNQIHLNMSDNFQLPNNLFVTDLSYAFYQCLAIEEFPANFNIPSAVTNLNYTFDSMRNLTKFPEKFKIPNSVTKMNYTFSSLYSCVSFPDDFVIPNSVEEMEGTFGSMYNLRGTITISSKAKNIDYLFVETARNVNKNLYGYDTPIVMKYYTSNDKVSAYSTNVKTTALDTKDNKVTKVPITNQSDWKKVKDDTNGTNTDNDGKNKYFLHYVGTATTVDLDDKTIYPLTSDGYPTILSSRVYNTYKMFAKNDTNDHNETLYRVFIPASIAIRSNGINTNTFLNTTQEIDCVYHTGNITNKTRGEGIDSTYDKTRIFDSQDNVEAYVWIGNENFERVYCHYDNGLSGESSFVTDYSNFGYIGQVKNVYVSEQVVSLDNLFKPIDPYPAIQINKVIVSDSGTWTSALSMFEGSTFDTMPNHFNLPKTVVRYWGLFARCINLKNIPSDFKINDSPYLQYSFAECNHLSGLIVIPSTTQTVLGTFTNVGNSTSIKYSGFNTPVVVATDNKTSVYRTLDSTIDKNCVTLVDINNLSVQSSSENDNPIAVAEEATNKIVIEDCTEEISVKVNEINNQKLTVEDKTEYVSVTVNKNSDENKDEVIDE